MHLDIKQKKNKNKHALSYTDRKNQATAISRGLVASYDIQPGNAVSLFSDTTHTHTYLLTYFHQTHRWDIYRILRLLASVIITSASSLSFSPMGLIEPFLHLWRKYMLFVVIFDDCKHNVISRNATRTTQSVSYTHLTLPTKRIV